MTLRPRVAPTRRSWLVRPDAALAAADARAAALGDAVRTRLVEACERLAESSPLLAARAYLRAADAWTRFGADGFARWVDVGATLASREPTSRDGALAYFAVAPEAFGPAGLDAAAAWCDLGRDVARVSRRLAGAFFERTPPALARDDGIPRLRAWTAAGLALWGSRGWRGAFLAQAWFDAAPGAILALGPAQYAPWAELAAALAGQVDERQFFATLPEALAGWSDAERESFLRSVLRIAGAAPRAAHAIWRDAPAALVGLVPAERAAWLAVVARLDASVASALAALVPVAGAIVRDVPADERLAALGMVERLASRSPSGAVVALPVLPRLYEEAGPTDVATWFAAGTAIAAENDAAGRAFFALASRTSLRVLRAASTAASLEETEGLWRKLVQMLSGEGATIRGFDGVSLRPPLEDAPAEREVALPVRIDALATHEDNCRVYRWLAAQLAGRREFGTYAVDDVRRRLARDDGGLLEEIFLVAEGVRVAHRVGGAYPGLAPEARWVATRLLGLWTKLERPARGVILDALLAVALGADGRPPWLPAEAAAVVGAAVAPLARADATVEDSIRVAEELAAAFAVPALRLPAAEIVPDLVLDDVAGGEPLDVSGASGPETPAGRDAERAPDAAPLELAPERAAGGGGQPLSADELGRLLEAGARIGQGTGDVGDGGIPITELVGKIAADRLDELRRLLADGERAAPRPGTKTERDDHAFFYDEWDHAIGDYRTRWCRLRECTLAGDSGEFFGRALAEYAAILPDVRRQFQRIRPEMYRPVRSLEDGEDFDLNAVTDARVEVRARRAPSSRLYRSRVREARDVATLFLLDMSASTDEPLGGRPGRRIIDALKEAVVIMTEALDELGDAYAIYGFSGQGRDNVEFYLVKGFAEPLGPSVKARIGGIVPKRSTRMGTALRHASRKMAAVAARAKHLILLSDGFPQDDDYGEDRRSHVYGIRDTAVALREADAAGITPFCITVDRAGHDYLREMCDASRYMVIDDIAALPRELPKIYRRVVRA